MTSGPEMALGCVAPRGKGARDEFLARVWATRIVCVSRAPAASRILRFFYKHSINTFPHIFMNIYLYKYTHVHFIYMNTSERLSRLDLEIHEIGHQECLAVGNVASH
jgi:hypothetical protein